MYFAANRLAEVTKRTLVVPDRGQCEGEIVLRLALVRLDEQGLSVLHDGLLRVARLLKGEGEIIVRTGRVRRERDGATVFDDGLGRKAGLHQGQPEIRVRIG